MTLSLTAEYLHEAIMGEQHAIEKYESFARIAYKEGFPHVATLFKALVQAEKIHVKNHKNAQKIIINKTDYLTSENQEPTSLGNTQTNVKNAIESELYEYRKMYPKFINNMKKSTQKTKQRELAILSMKWAREVELTHAKALKIALKYISRGVDLDIKTIWVCKVCGNLILSNITEPPKELCPICGHDPYFYQKVEDFQIIDSDQ
ncbi:rubrerythrin family protein [Candidatus Harpocratesius sp.]